MTWTLAPLFGAVIILVALGVAALQFLKKRAACPVTPR
jgi:hypothetical protein